MRRTFLEFVQEKKKAEGDETVTSRVSLGDGNDFEPFVVSDDPNSEFYGKNKNLAPIVRAFKKGANWGWSRDEKSGQDKPVKVGGKKLFLTGGALRDHLAGKKPRNMELATNCSPDEVYHILTQNKFDFIGDETEGDVAGSVPGDMNGGGKETFWVKKKDKKGRPYVFGIKVKNDEFELAVFTKTSKGADGQTLEPGTHADDASGRDFTINSMYLTLAQDNGPNKEMFDFFGGSHHLKSGKIAAVGNLEQKLKEDPMRALRYVRMMSRYGNPKSVTDEDKNTVRNSAEYLKKLNPRDMMAEFQKGLNYEDGDSRQYIKQYADMGLLGALFPGMNLDTKLPKQLREMGDKHAPLAWMLRNHDPKELEATMKADWKPEDVKKVSFLIKSLKMNPDMDENGLEDLIKSYMQSGISGRKLKMWITKLGGKQDGLADAFLQHAQSPRIKTHMGAGLEESIAPQFADLVDFSGNLQLDAAERRKKRLELENFRSILKFHLPNG
jgi:tRNA nucleotidyltransferase/poly(A) polymerase